ncbi:MAG: PRTRC system protein B [Candidatus Pedobacter colombiensis]|uniref:PRTRC system protein B n=1 Tax=Candidatus Pedobacter colombiensis TaxID=3121371 RepID=A0AAJ5W3P9_9SPHI|nr:PRTRC system protein B [Pedobacter sp.]WEK17948.1 MAG: PRTRC system protein B [Pedobacter sp.]
MNNITPLFEQVYLPQKALLIYQTLEEDKDIYVEAYDIDDHGSPINAHPLSTSESVALANSLAASRQLQTNFLQSEGLLPEKLLYMEIGISGFAVWYSPEQKEPLFFTDSLGIPCGQAHVPALIWKADKKSLEVFAYKGKEKPVLETPLFNAPFFNMYSSGKVCMGTVNSSFTDDCCLETFIQQWEHAFFNSYFSHTIGGHVPVKGNLVSLWHSLVNSDDKFPESRLVKTNRSLKDLLK